MNIPLDDLGNPVYHYYDNNSGVSRNHSNHYTYQLPHEDSDPTYISATDSSSRIYSTINSRHFSNITDVGYSDDSSAYFTTQGIPPTSGRDQDLELPIRTSWYKRLVICCLSVLFLVLLAPALLPLIFTLLTSGTQVGNPPINGIWTDWQTWSTCSVTCGNGSITRSRNCDNPPPSSGGNDCKGSASDTQNCTLTHCPVNGNWSEWLPWSSCSTSCDDGIITRNRTCDNPLPAFGGEVCEGNDTDYEVCMLKHCPIHGNWSSWQNWSSCSATCGGGERSRSRECNDPRPQYSGEDCVGPVSETSTCGDVSCPPPGTWGIWSEWTDCSATCGEGMSNRARDCDNSAGGECVGAETETKVCQKWKCYDSWGDWSECSFSCGTGIRTRNRTCDGLFTGQMCGWNTPTFTDVKACSNTGNPCDVSFCSNRTAECSYKHPNRCDMYITCDASQAMLERVCNVLLRYKVMESNECTGHCDFEANVPCP